MLKEIKYNELKTLRKEWYDEQEGIDPVLKKHVEFKDTCMDHIHKRKDEEPDEEGKGCLRGCLDFRVNAFLGKVENAYKRYGLHNEMELTELLSNLTDYLLENKSKKEIKIVHPSERVVKKLKKNSYNKLKKKINGEVKLPKYTGRYTKALKDLFDKYSLTPDFYC